MSLRPFRAVPTDAKEWARWMKEQKVITSTPTTGYYKVLDLYYDLDNDELVVIYNDEAESG